MVKLVMQKCFWQKKTQAGGLIQAQMEIWILCHKSFLDFELVSLQGSKQNGIFAYAYKCLNSINWNLIVF